MTSHKAYEVEEDSTTLDAVASAGIHIPMLCYLKGINEIGACRVCMVELAGKDKLAVLRNNRVEEGMVVYTNSPRVRETRRGIVELILSQHDCYRFICVRGGNYDLQRIANGLGILDLPYQHELPVSEWDKRSPLIRDFSKCIRCMRCIQICDEIQGMHIWDTANTGPHTTVDVTWNRKMEDSDCVLCGQCIIHCPVGALCERDDTEKAFVAPVGPDKVTVVQIAFFVRAAQGEPFGLPCEQATAKRPVAVLCKIGFRYIFDTNFAAGLTIMEEGSELLEKPDHPEAARLPTFTSYCLGWMRFTKPQYPDMAGNLSSAKSLQQMSGAVAKSCYAGLLNVDPKQIYFISVMPCLAKKDECVRKVLDDVGVGQDAGLVLTTREIDRMIHAEHILVSELQEEEFDMSLGVGIGAAVIFGITDGAMQAALRSAYYLTTGENPDPEVFLEVGGVQGREEVSFHIADRTLRVAVVNGLGGARKLMELIRTGRIAYDFVEVIACPGGCAGGGGQPITDGMEFAQIRGEQLYELDKGNTLRSSHENPAVPGTYRDCFEKPLSERFHKLPHIKYKRWECPFSPYPNQDRSNEVH